MSLAVAILVALLNATPPAAPAHTWLVDAAVAWQPIGQTPWPELRGETEAETRARYGAMAAAAERVAFAPQHPPLFPGDRGRWKTAAQLMAIAWLESGFHNRVTTMRGADRERSDHGKSWCAGQILMGREGRVTTQGTMAYLAAFIPEGWTGPDLEADPEKCLTVVYRMLRSSFAKCEHGARLGSYTGEGCNPAKAPKAVSRHRRALSIRPPRPDAWAPSGAAP